ncbi:hypothetical protein [Cohnella abietis]|uniref:Uncharacterized protein n=1 Tax=Cohnella abietis TaxID=2507935 RepID=A0A3T1DF68_9BACL|nr:hypothetical protein [Cohnella abietis]BBI36777.1 hypothetical protein KCTCHS21_61760 [Cohnella abietis]
MERDTDIGSTIEDVYRNMDNAIADKLAKLRKEGHKSEHIRKR